MKKISNPPIAGNKTLNPFDARQWEAKTKHANYTFAKNNLPLAYQLYLETLAIAKQLFSQFKNYHPVPSALTPILVISYLNLADCRARQQQKTEQISNLFEIYSFLKHMFTDSLISEELSQQIYQGVSKIHSDLCLCLKRNGSQEELAQLKADFSVITTTYQAQTWALH